MKKKQKKPPLRAFDQALIWKCWNCGDYNMHPINMNDFECISCGSRFTAGAHSEIVWRKP